MKPILCVGLSMLLACAVFASKEDEAKRSAGAERTAKATREKIAAEIKRLKDHPWAGEYYAGDGLGVNTTLAIAPKSGFLFEWHGCLGLYDRNFGTVTSTNARLQLLFTFENQREGLQGLAPVLIPIPWGGRRYLVPSDDITGFCNQVNNGSEPRKSGHGEHLLRKGDEEKPVAGAPKVPKAFRPYLLPAPITAEIISVGGAQTQSSVAEWKFTDISVVLNAGANKGLRPGMELLVTEPANVVESVRITKVEVNHSEGIMTRSGEEEPSPQVGWRFSTRAPWAGGR